MPKHEISDPGFFYIIQARVAGNARKFIQIFSSSDTIEFITMLTRIRPITHCACIDLHFSHWASFADKRLNLGKFYTNAEPTFTQIYMCTFPVSLNRAKIINILLHAEYARRRMLVTTRGCVKFLITTVSKNLAWMAEKDRSKNLRLGHIYVEHPP